MGQAQLELGLTVTGCLLAPLSLLVTITAVLELLLILGPVWKCTTWWPHNALLLLLWLPHLGVAGWQLHEGLALPTTPFIAIGAFFIVTHMLLLFCYWLRRILRKQAAKELPTQELLTEAQRIMMAGGASDAVGQGVWAYGAAANHFPMQPGRMDGRDGATVYIPGELQEAVIQDLVKRGWGAPSPTSMAPPPPSSMGLPRNDTGGRAQRQLHSSVQSLRSSQGGLPPPSPSATIRGGPPSARSQRHVSGSPEQSSAGAGGMSAGSQGRGERGVIQVLLPEALARWNTSGKASIRYKHLTDSALPSPAASVGMGEQVLGGVGAAGGMSGSVFAMQGPQAAAAAGMGGGEMSGAAQGGDAGRMGRVSAGGGMVEASNPLFSADASLAHELSLRVDSLRAAGAVGGVNSVAMASDAVLMPSPVGAVSTTSPPSLTASTPPVTCTTTPTAAGVSSSAAWPRASTGLPASREGSISSSRPPPSREMSAARLSLDPSAMNTATTPTSANPSTSATTEWRTGLLWGLGKQSHQPQSARGDESGPGSVDWEREFGVSHASNVAMSGNNAGGSVVGVSGLMTSSLVTDPGSRVNLLDVGQSNSSSTAPGPALAMGLATPDHSITAGASGASPLLQHSGTGGSVMGEGGAGNRSSGSKGGGGGGGGGLLGVRLGSWRGQHTRNHSFPLASSLTAALLQDQDSSADVSGSPRNSGAGNDDRGLFSSSSPRHQQQQQGGTPPPSAPLVAAGAAGNVTAGGSSVAPPSPAWRTPTKKL